MSTLSPNMNLPISTIGVDSGLNWETNLNAALTLLDGHTHAPGSGIAIQPSGLNINSDLTFQNNQATNLKSTAFTAQTSLTTLRAVYVKSVDLYYRDGSNNEIQLTSGGSVNATTSGISSGSATASFVSSVLVVNSASNTPANIQGRSILLGNNVSGSHYVTLSAPAALAADYTLTLPATPASTKIMALDASGNMSAPYTVDGSTLEISSNVIQVKALGIGTAQLAAASVTKPKLAALGQQISNGSGGFSTGSVTPVDVSNLLVDITTTGRPVMVFMQPTSGTSTSRIFVANSTGLSAVGAVRLVRDGTTIAIAQFQTIADVSSVEMDMSNILQLDPVAAGTYEYKIQAQITTGNAIGVENFQLVAYEVG